MVTWGQNTVHTFAGTPAPTPGGGLGSSSSTGFFGSPSPAPSTGFGAPAPAPGGLFGSSAPAPSGGLFGSSAPAPSGGLFGSTTPAPSGGFFGSTTTTAPAPSGGLFGTTPAPFGGGLFGSAPSSGGMFGSPPAAPFGAPPQQQPQMIPAQAALQAHMDASARQEEAKVQVALEKIQKAYTGQTLATEKESAHFTSILYNPASSEMRQVQWLRGIGVDGRPHPIAPPKPPQISERQWEQAVVRNPDMLEYMPIALVGAEDLRARLSFQQEQSDVMAKQVESIQQTQDLVRQRCENAQQRLNEMTRQQALQKKRLLTVMRKVELARCFNQPWQQDEVKASEKLMEIYQQVEHLRGVLGSLADKARTDEPVRPPQVTAIPDQKELMDVLTNHHHSLETATLKAQRDIRDLQLIKERVESVSHVNLPGRPRGY